MRIFTPLLGTFTLITTASRAFILSDTQSLSTGSTGQRFFSFFAVPRMSSTSAGAASAAADSTAEDAAVAGAARSRDLFSRTPLVRSAPFSALANRPVYVKLDALQASGSFKDRGMGHLCETLQSTKGTNKLISSSGGNAGLAVATVGAVLGMTVQVVVPETTKPMVIQKLKSLGAEVTVHGENWNAADVLARELCDGSDGDAEYVSPYDNPLLWTGHSTAIDEIVDDLEKRQRRGEEGGERLGAIVASVGGGGLLCGIFEGLRRHGAVDGTAVIAAETEGAASFGRAFARGEGPVRLEAIDSIATSLGALEVTNAALERAADHVRGGGSVRSALCTDAEAVDACLRFAADHRVLVEPACGAALAVLYSDRLREEHLRDVDGAVVIEVCGGSGVNVELLETWRQQLL